MNIPVMRLRNRIFCSVKVKLRRQQSRGRKEKELNTECMSSKQVSAWGFVITKTFKERLRKMKLPKKCIVALSRTELDFAKVVIIQSRPACTFSSWSFGTFQGFYLEPCHQRKVDPPTKAWP